MSPSSKNNLELTLNELELTTSTTLTVLFTLFYAGINRQQVVFLKQRTKLTIKDKQRTSNAKLNGMGLSYLATTLHVGVDVKVFVFARNLEGSLGGSAGYVGIEVICYLTAVDVEVACAALKPNACNS